MALLPFQRKAYWGFLSLKKSDGFNQERTRDLAYQRPNVKELIINWERLLPKFNQTSILLAL
jgi:hypothetical protein